MDEEGIVRRQRVSKRLRQHKRAASHGDYAKMVAAATAVVIENRGMQYRTGNPEYVLFRFPYWVKFTKGFPKGHITEKTPTTSTYKMNAVKLLDWLHANGHSAYDSKELVRQTREFEALQGGVTRMFEEELW